jgi:hypothetical protein
MMDPDSFSACVIEESAGPPSLPAYRS